MMDKGARGMEQRAKTNQQLSLSEHTRLRLQADSSKSHLSVIQIKTYASMRARP